MDRRNWLGVTASTGILLPIEAFFGFGLWFAPGWANGWPGGLRIHLVWPAGMAVVVTAMFLTAAAGAGAALMATTQPPPSWPPGRQAVCLGCLIGFAGTLVWFLLFGYFRFAALEMWPNGYNPGWHAKSAATAGDREVMLVPTLLSYSQLHRRTSGCTCAAAPCQIYNS